MSEARGRGGGLFRRVAGVTGRILLSCLVLWFAGICLSLFLKSPLQGAVGEPDRDSHTASGAVSKPGIPQTANGFWPRYPSSYAGSSRAMEVNGVKFIVETSRTWASPSAVLDYYQCQMTARGWRDVTEESHNLQPEARRERTGEAGLQDRTFLEIYRKVKDTTRVFGNGLWTIHLYAEESAENKGQTVVMINAAAVPSLKGFADVWSALGRSDSPGNNELDVVEHRGGQRYHTRITVHSRPPAAAFAEALEQRRQDSWRPSLVSVASYGSRDHVAMLVKGGQYASLTATETKDGRKTSVTWTEVTPE